jgi:hypothetical protein
MWFWQISAPAAPATIKHLRNVPNVAKTDIDVTEITSIVRFTLLSVLPFKRQNLC